MDIVAIKEAIQNLEREDATADNVLDLAALYTVYAQLLKNTQEDGVQDELDDIFPYYRKYRIIKQKYQLNQVIDSEVIQGIKDVCQEIKEFIDVLYSNTDMHKERMCIKKLIQELAEKYKD